MDLTIQPRLLRGDVSVIPSKSQAHRLLICAAFADAPTQLHCPATNRDMEATADCLRALGAEIHRTNSGYTVFPAKTVPETALLPCGESGSTLRFLLPIVGALGVDGVFRLEGRLPQRPLSPLWEEIERMGCRLSRPTQNTVRCQGQLRSGDFTIAGNVSSQFITGLLFAAALLEGDSAIHITGKLESKPYIAMTQEALAKFGVSTENYQVPGGQQLRSPGYLAVEGDWSNGSFFLAAQFLGCPLTVSNLDPVSSQGDRAVLTHMQSIVSGTPTISAGDIPDLVPILSVTAGAYHGAVFTDIARLRLKESDRVASVIAMVNALGGKAEATENTLTVSGTGFRGGTVDSCNDHRIAMSAAIASTVCKEPVTVLCAEAVNKSYPQFWQEFTRLGGKL